MHKVLCARHLMACDMSFFFVLHFSSFYVYHDDGGNLSSCNYWVGMAELVMYHSLYDSVLLTEQLLV